MSDLHLSNAPGYLLASGRDDFIFRKKGCERISNLLHWLSHSKQNSPMRKISGSVWKLNLSIYATYILITVIVTYPVVQGVVNPYIVPQVGGDSIYFLWHIWWIKHALLNLRMWPTFTQAIFYPTGGVLFLASPFNELASLTLQPLLGLTRTYNFMWLFSFPTAGFTTYLLGFYFSRHRWVAFIGGLIFSFSARHYAQGSHLGLMVIQWLPLYILALFLLLNKPIFKRGALTAAGFILAVSSEHVYYVFYFVVPVTGLFLLYHWFIRYPRLRQRSFWLAFSSALLVGILFVFPIYLHLLANRNEEFIQGTGKGILQYSADVLAYFTPPQKHPLWQGSFIDSLYESFGGNEEEDTIFIGYAALILIFLGIRTWRNRVTGFWLLLGILAFIFSLGPVLHFRSPINKDFEMNVALPYSFLANLPLVGVLRVPARLSVTVQLAVAVLATCGLTRVTKNWSGIWRIAAYTTLGIFILFESLFQFPYPVENNTLVPPTIYEQIAQEENQLALLEIPLRQRNKNLVPTGGFHRRTAFYYLYYATIHQHPLIGGESARTPPDSANFLDTTAVIRELMYPQDLVNNTSDIVKTDLDGLIKYGPKLLAKHNIGYLVVHRNFLDESSQQGLMQILTQALGNPFYNDGQLAGFRVPQKNKLTPATRETFILGDGWYPKTELYDRPVRWMGQTGIILIDQPDTVLTQLSITAFSPMANPVTVVVTINDVAVETFQATSNPEKPKTFITRVFTLNSGTNEVKFKVQPIGQPIQQLDPRVYLGVYNISKE